MKNLFAGLIVASLVITGCSVQSKHEDGDSKKNVKIETPLGGMNVNTENVEAKDAGRIPWR
jgi:hypothetical protein